MANGWERLCYYDAGLDGGGDGLYAAWGLAKKGGKPAGTSESNRVGDQGKERKLSKERPSGRR